MTYAIYFEGTSEDDTLQAIFVPSCAIGGRAIHPRFARRHVSNRRPSSAWEVIPNDAYSFMKSKSDDDAQPGGSERALGEELAQIESISPYLLDTLGDPSVTLLGSFPIALTTTDILEMHDAPRKMPQGLLSRVRERRSAQGWDPLPLANGGRF